MNEAEAGPGGAEGGHQPAGEDEVETDEEGEEEQQAVEPDLAGHPGQLHHCRLGCVRGRCCCCHTPVCCPPAEHLSLAPGQLSRLVHCFLAFFPKRHNVVIGSHSTCLGSPWLTRLAPDWSCQVDSWLVQV